MNTIYVYTTNTDRQLGRYKFGQTERNALKRIKEQDSTSNPEKLEIVYEIQSNLSDKQIHNQLEDYGFTKCRDNREWFQTFKNDEEVIIILNKIISLSGIDTRKLYNPRFYQDYVKMLFIDKLLKNKQEKIDFALELAPRFGKTIWTIDLIQTLFNEYGYKICFLPAYVLTVFKSFEKDFYDFKGYSNNIIYLKKGDDVEKIISENYGKKMIIIEISLCTTEYKEKLKFVKDIPSHEKVSFMDESDFGTHRILSQEFIRFIDSKLNVYMSGTGIEKITNILENLYDNTIFWSYIDMLLTLAGEHPLQKHLNND